MATKKKDTVSMVRVVLTRSLIGCNPAQKANAASLGLRKIGDSIEHANDGVLAGKLRVIGHLVKVESL